MPKATSVRDEKAVYPMHKIEAIIGACLISIGIVPVSFMTVAGQLLPQMPENGCFGPAGYSDGEGCGLGSRMQTQFIVFWSFISSFLLGIGVWFTIAGLTSKAILSKPN